MMIAQHACLIEVATAAWTWQLPAQHWGAVMFRQDQPFVTIITSATGLGLSPYAGWAGVQLCRPKRTADVPWKETGWHYKGTNYEA